MRPLSIPCAIVLLALVACGPPRKSDHGSGYTRTTASAATTTCTTCTTPTTTTTTPSPGPTQTAPAPTTTPAAPTTTVGSRFWYEGDTFGNPFKTHDATEADWATQILMLVNRERVNAQLRVLLPDPEAELAAKVHAEDMAARNFFDHFTPEGWSPYDRLLMTGASGFTMSGENVAYGQPTPAAVMIAWMNSPGHRANILHPDWTHIGMGVAKATPYWAQVFLKR